MEGEKRIIEALAPIPIRLENYDYKKYKFDYDANGNLIYIGKNEDAEASDDANDWIIYKIIYDNDTKNIIEIKVKIGAWSQRDTLF